VLIASGLVLVLPGSSSGLGQRTRHPPQPKSPVAPSTTEPRSTASSRLAGGDVAIGVGDNAQNVVNAHGAGTTYIVKPGTHLRNFSVQPKSGDRF
jgi:hypothetical protein